MDPNKTYRDLQTMSMRVLKSAERGESSGHSEHEVLAFAELFEALDGWLRAKGALPDAWKR